MQGQAAEDHTGKSIWASLYQKYIKYREHGSKNFRKTKQIFPPNSGIKSRNLYVLGKCSTSEHICVLVCL